MNPSLFAEKANPGLIGAILEEYGVPDEMIAKLTDVINSPWPVKRWHVDTHDPLKQYRDRETRYLN